jgi:hypothetical protein
MSSVVISGDTSGAITLAAPAVSGTNTINLPAATGTVMVSGNMPAFSAYQSASQTLGSATFTKIQLQSEVFDTNNAFDSTTNYRFQPTVAGYYQISGSAYASTNSVSLQAVIYKNGSAYQYGFYLTQMSTISSIIYLNGSTDYVEFYTYSSGSVVTNASANANYFSGAMIRAA